MTDFKTKMAELAAKYNISHKRDIDWHNFVAEVEQLTEAKEQPEVDLEKEVISYFQGMWPDTSTAEGCNTQMSFTPPAILRLARHIAEWQKAKMMEGSVEAKIYGYDDGSFELIASWLDMPKNSIYKDGQKIRIIIVKEDEK